MMLSLLVVQEPLEQVFDPTFGLGSVHFVVGAMTKERIDLPELSLKLSLVDMNRGEVNACIFPSKDWIQNYSCSIQRAQNQFQCFQNLQVLYNASKNELCIQGDMSECQSFAGDQFSFVVELVQSRTLVSICSSRSASFTVTETFESRLIADRLQHIGQELVQWAKDFPLTFFSPNLMPTFPPDILRQTIQEYQLIALAEDLEHNIDIDIDTENITDYHCMSVSMSPIRDSLEPIYAEGTLCNPPSESFCLG